jgi:ribosomal protein L13
VTKKRSFDSYVRNVQQRLDNLDDRETALLYNNRNKGAMQVLAKVLGTELGSAISTKKFFARGGKVLGMQAGGVAQQPQPAGEGRRPPENFTDGQTVADDQPMSVPEGTFVINAAAVEFAGSEDIKKMLSDAYRKMQKKVDKSIGVVKIPTEDEIDVAVSRGEVIVPPEVAKIIGYDRLKKINNRGKKEVSRRQKKAGGGFLNGKKFAEGGEADFEYEDRIIADEVRRKMKKMLGDLPKDITVTSEYYEDQPTAKVAGRLYEGKTVSDYQKALADASGMVPITGRFKANPRTKEINVPQTPTLFNLFAIAEEIAHLDYLDKRRTNPYPDPETLGSFFNPSAQMNKKYSQYDKKIGAKEPFNPYEAFEMEERYNEEVRAKAIAYETVRGMLPKSKKTANFTKLGYQEGFARYVYDNAPPAIRAGLFNKYPELQQFVDDKDRFVSKRTPIINAGVKEYNKRAREIEAQRKK